MPPVPPSQRESPCARRPDCRACSSLELESVLDFGETPLANAFPARDAAGLEEPRFPLEVFQCRSCGLVQLRDVVDPGLLFQNYLYVSSTSPSFVEHFRRYAANVVAEFQVPRGSLVVEVGSNDGILLRHFLDLGMRVQGVDPAREIAERATRDGIPTWPQFFDLACARKILAEHGPARVWTANNVLAHVDDLPGVLDAARILLAPEGVAVFEVSYLLDVVEKTLFDMTYHEHLCYHAVAPLEGLLRRHGLRLVEAVRVPTHGGSLRAMAVPEESSRARGNSVDALLELESRAGLADPATLRAFGAEVQRRGEELRSMLVGLKSAGNHIAGFGAPAKLTTLMHVFRIGPELIDFVVDDSPLKQGRLTPGMQIPVVPVAQLYARLPEYCLVLAWNFAEIILKNHQAYMEQGGRFILPLPQLEVKGTHGHEFAAS